MSTRIRFVLAGLAVALISVSLMMVNRSGNRGHEDLRNQLAAQSAAHAKDVAELQAKRDEDIAKLDENYISFVRAAGEAINDIRRAAEAELRKAKQESEQQLADLMAASDAEHAKDVARIAALEQALAENGNDPTNSDLATIWKEYNGVVKIYEYASFEFTGIKGVSIGPDGDIKIETGKFKFNGRIGHLSGFVDELRKKPNGANEDYQYLWSAGHLKDRDNSPPIKELWAVFRDDLNLPSEKLELVGYDWRYDLSLLRFRKGFVFPGKAFRLGDVDSVQPGDKVVAMGCPLDAQFAATEGEVMDKEYVGAELGFTQPRIFVHSAPITFGNSGGPLILKRTGEVIAVNVMLVDEPGGYFLSTMVDDMKAMYPRLKAAHGTEVLHSTLEHAAFSNSWRLNPPDWELIGVKPITEHCVVATEVMKDSVADKAGLRAGDIVLSWNGVAPKNDADLWRMITNVVPSAVGTMKVQRGTEVKYLTLALSIFKGEVFVHEWYKEEEIIPPKQ